ncbi:hypothetical protein GQ44DRAFT_696523 [Phaeosphaeriaceae sp. PMI808]|nr:hypothetical protein GQ44DRAFT_696523 [Phaeosphaeriaceae sp. PMI808]
MAQALVFVSVKVMLSLSTCQPVNDRRLSDVNEFPSQTYDSLSSPSSSSSSINHLPLGVLKRVDDSPHRPSRIRHNPPNHAQSSNYQALEDHVPIRISATRCYQP